MRNVYRYGFDDPYRLDPTPLYAKLRADEPVARVSTPYGDDAWLVTRHRSVRYVLHDPRFSRSAAVAQDTRLPRASAHVPRGNPLAAVDPPEHSRYRQLIAGALTRRSAEEYRPRAVQIANELIDEMVAAGPPVDLIGAFAHRFPILSFGEILGVPRADCLDAKDWTAPILTRRGYPAEQIAAAYTRLLGYLTGLLTDRQTQPRDDLMTSLVQSQLRRSPVSRDNLLLLVASLLINDSVANQVGSGLYLLLTHPDQTAWLRADPHRIPRAVEELLRFAPLAPDAPSGGQGNARYAVTDSEVDGVTIRAGEWVLPSITSANRDERVFAGADRLDLRRTHNPHLAFGFGTHHCPGAAIGRMQLQVAVATLLDRFPELRLAAPVEELVWKSGKMNRGLVRLPVRW